MAERPLATDKSMPPIICMASEDPNPQETMKLNNQILPPRIFGVFPKSILHYFMTPFANNLGWWGVNTAKYIASFRRHTFRQPHAAFHFLLDYVPNWELSYGAAD